MEVYIKGRISEDGTIAVPLSSAAVIFVLKYCDTSHVCKLFLVEEADSQDVTVTLGKSSLQEFTYSPVNKKRIPEEIQNCALPVVQDEGDSMIRSGLCSIVRHIVKFSSDQPSHKDSNFIDLLGFRAGSLKACSEVSGWTKLCEIELPDSISTLIQTFRSGPDVPETLELPADLMKLELHLEKPPLLHNVDKKKRDLLKQIKKETKRLCAKSNSNDENGLIDQFFTHRTISMTHGDVYYRVISKGEKEAKKFVNTGDGDSGCKFGCTEDRLRRWCAKCNDRERLRQKEKKQQQMKARKTVIDGNKAPENHNGNGDRSVPSVDNNKVYNNVDKTSNGVTSVDGLVAYVDSLTLYDIAHEHMYAEGVAFTIADIMLFTYVYFLFESMEFKVNTLLLNMPYLQTWLRHILTLPRMQQTTVSCGLNMAAMSKCLAEGDEGHTLNVKFSIPEVSLDVEEDSNEISRRYRGKIKALKNEITALLVKVQESGIEPKPEDHPRGDNVHVDWDSVPDEAHPKIELPAKRVGRKCEQLENLATAVQAIAKPGDIIVDFCSGGGHLGIIIAHLLPQCKVYLVENNEESLKRARTRVKSLNLSNITLYQCNLDYFQGHFTIGTCLHACGVATDLVLQQCLDKKASFVICPCCYGSIQNTHLITYPRSQQYREAGFTDKDVIMLGHAADQTEETIELKSQGRLCMNLVDSDRAQIAMERGYKVTLCSLRPLTCTPKNNLIIGEALT